jgi:hypothetical protein
MATVTTQTDGLGVSGGGASATFGPASLLGGYYGLDISSLTGSGGTLTLQRLMADGTTVNVLSYTVGSVTAHTVLQLPPGLYQLATNGSVTNAEAYVGKIKGGL